MPNDSKVRTGIDASKSIEDNIKPMMPSKPGADAGALSLVLADFVGQVDSTDAASGTDADADTTPPQAAPRPGQAKQKKGKDWADWVKASIRFTLEERAKRADAQGNTSFAQELRDAKKYI